MNRSQSEDNPQEEQSPEKPQDQPTASDETPQPSVFSEEYIDSLVKLNPDFEEESQNSEESTATDE